MALKTWTLRQYMEEKFESFEPIVDGILRNEEMVIVSATAKSGKSILVTNLSLSVAFGTDFLGHHVQKKGKVILWQTEVSNSAFQERLKKMLNGRTDSLDDLHIICERIRIDRPEGLKAVEEKLKEISPTLLVLDPFYTLHRADEDKSSSIAPILSDLRQLARAAKCALVLVHHQGKRGEVDGRQTGHQHRGSSSFADVPDSSWSLDRKSESSARLSFESRNDRASDPISICLNENLLWIPSSINFQDLKPTFRDAATMVADREGMSKTELIEAVSTRFNICSRTSESLISEALDKGTVRKQQNGKFVRYFLPDQRPQNRRPLEKRVVADEGQLTYSTNPSSYGDHERAAIMEFDGKSSSGEIL